MSPLCTGRRLAKNVIAETDAKIYGYNNVFEALMQQFRDGAVRDTALGVHNIGEVGLTFTRNLP
jgi:hypothetical protein